MGKQMIRFIGLLFFTLGLSACQFPPRLYRMNIEQGNHLKKDVVANLKKGMNMAEVKALLGNSLLESPYAQPNTVYVYEFISGETGEYQKQCLLLEFKQGRLERFHFQNS